MLALDPKFSITAHADRLGRASVVIPKRAKYSVAASCDGQGRQWAIELPAKSTTLDIPAPVWVSGVVSNGDGVPLEGATIFISYASSSKRAPLLAKLQGSTHGKSGPGGKYRIAVRQGTQVWVSASWRHAGRSYSSRNSNQLQVGTESIELDLAVPDAPDPRK